MVPNSILARDAGRLGQHLTMGSNEQATPVLPGRDQAVLIVEPDRDVRRMLARTLDRAGFKTVEAEDALEAMLLSAVNPVRIGVLVVEVRMKNISGPELADTFISVYPHAKVLYIGASDSGYSVQNLVAKPFKGSVVVDRVSALMEASRGPS